MIEKEEVEEVEVREVKKINVGTKKPKNGYLQKNGHQLS